MVSNVLGAAADAAPKRNVGLLAKREADASSTGMDSAQQQSYQTAPAAQPVQSLSEVKQQKSNSYLSSFSWNDDAPADTSKQAQQQTVESKPAPQIPGASNNLMAWLSGTSKQPAPQEQPAAPVAQKPAANSYLMDLQ